MTRVMAIAIVLASGGCRRHHAATSYESDNVAMAPAPPVAAPPATGEPAAPAPAPPTTPREAMPDGGTINGDPKGPRAAEFNKVVDSALPPLQACLDRAELPGGSYDIVVHYVVEYPGYTGAVTAKGDKVPKPALDCCVAVVEGLKFPQYRGGRKVERDLPFTYRKTEPTTVRVDAAVAK
jgi:hypothetical protein